MAGIATTPTSAITNDTTDFPYTLTISVPLPTHRLAHIALRALQVDAELSPLVKRRFSLAHSHSHSHSQSDGERNDSHTSTHGPVNGTLNARETSSSGDVIVNVSEEGHPEHTTDGHQSPSPDDASAPSAEHSTLTVLKTEYRATTNRMLRVAVNGFMESLGVVVGVMEELDGDVLDGEDEEGG